MLESDMCAYEQKLRILDLFQLLCRDPDMLVYLFVHYDMDRTAAVPVQLFARIFSALAKYSKVKKIKHSFHSVFIFCCYKLFD